MNYVQSSYTELNDRYQMRIFDWISLQAHWAAESPYQPMLREVPAAAMPTIWPLGSGRLSTHVIQRKCRQRQILLSPNTSGRGGSFSSQIIGTSYLGTMFG